MGLFTSVWIELPCERCDTLRRTEIQFKTGDAYLANYEVGDVVPDGDAMRIGEPYRGITGRYCRGCRQEWTAAESDASAEVLAELIESGRLAISERDSGEVVSAAAVRERGRRDADAIAASAGGLPPGRFVFDLGPDAFDVVWEGKRLKQASERWWSYLEAHSAALDATMKGRGWPAGRDQHSEDISVLPDEDRRIHVGLPV